MEVNLGVAVMMEEETVMREPEVKQPVVLTRVEAVNYLGVVLPMVVEANSLVEEMMVAEVKWPVG